MSEDTERDALLDWANGLVEGSMVAGDESKQAMSRVIGQTTIILDLLVERIRSQDKALKLYREQLDST